MVLSLLRKLEAFKNDDDIHYTPNIEACQVESLSPLDFDVQLIRKSLTGCLGRDWSTSRITIV